jgi:hypothetical protein
MGPIDKYGKIIKPIKKEKHVTMINSLTPLFILLSGGR